MKPFTTIVEYPPGLEEWSEVILILLGGTFLVLFVWQQLRCYSARLRIEDQIELLRVQAERRALTLPDHESSP